MLVCSLARWRLRIHNRSSLARRNYASCATQALRTAAAAQHCVDISGRKSRSSDERASSSGWGSSRGVSAVGAAVTMMSAAMPAAAAAADEDDAVDYANEVSRLPAHGLLLQQPCCVGNGVWCLRAMHACCSCCMPAASTHPLSCQQQPMPASYH